MTSQWRESDDIKKLITIHHSQEEIENCFTMSQVKDKEGKPIKEADVVSGKRRGGKQFGQVEEVIRTKEQAKEADVRDPPKVLFTDQHGTSTPEYYISYQRRTSLEP